jgi:putative nucleotidyltransferase with HDIG domain
MDKKQLTRRAYWAAEIVLFFAALGADAWLARSDEWKPVFLALLLPALMLVGDRLDLEIRGQRLTASFIPLTLAMSLLGPVPAVVFGLTAIIVQSIIRKQRSVSVWLCSLSGFATFPLAGGLIVRLVLGDIHTAHGQHLSQSVSFAFLVFGVFLATNALNFALVALDNHIVDGHGSMLEQARSTFVPMLPGQIAAGGLAAVLAVAYTNLGFSSLFGAVLILMIFQYLMRALLRSEDRADQLEARSIHLASLQLGVLTTLVETLALRDRTTARHAAAVARYARELACAINCSEAEQELVHTAGLLHDIGKFALPDNILHASVLSDDDWSVIRRHPQDGATLVGRLDGYGAVADAILYHHEHVDGSGYPAGLIGNEIPLASRILAICSTYDTLTARETYRSPMNPKDAITELRRVSGRQLDGELVESFIAMLEVDGPVTLVHGDDADFQAELAFGRRAGRLAQPQ